MDHLPQNVHQPFFAYGTLKSSELAHRQIESFVTSCSTACLEGYELLVADGIPRAFPSQGSVVIGELIELDPAGYEKIARYEQTPGRYVWTEAEVNGAMANLVVYSSQIETRHDKVERWEASDDTMLADGMVWALKKLVQIRRFTSSRQTHRLVDEESKAAFVELQSVYSILWSVFERLTLFCEGPLLQNEKMGQRIGKIAGIDAWKSAYEQAGGDRALSVRSSSDPFARPKRPGSFGFEAWYQLRNNVIHRGKSAGREFSQLLVAAIDMFRTLALFELEQSESLKKFLEKRLTPAEMNLILIGFTPTELSRLEENHAK